MPPPTDDNYEKLSRSIDRLIHVVERLEAAFPRNDLGQPDVDGHRQFHIDKIRQASEVRGYQMAVTQKILLWGVGIVLTILGTGFWQTVSDKFKALGA